MQIESGLQNVMRSELEAEEKLLWADSPNALRSLYGAFAAWVFAVPWTAFSAFWIWGALDFGYRPIQPGWTFDFLFPFFGLPFLLIGFGMLSVPYWTFRQAQQTIYAITDRRVLVIIAGKKRIVESYSGEDIGTVKRTERSDGTGNLTFAQKMESDGDGGQRKTDISFVGIPNVRAVENLLRTTFKKN